MSSFLEKTLIVLGLLTIGAVAGVLAVLLIDPACGPWGDEQMACARQLVDDLTPGSD